MDSNLKTAPPTGATTPRDIQPSASDTTVNRWPRQVKYIVGNEACERFSYYGMRGILALYIATILRKSPDDVTNIMALFIAVTYFTPLLGAWVSDRFWGRYRTILWVSLCYCLGHAVLATSDLFHTVDGKSRALYVGLGLIAFGAGGIKPCVSAFMGDQFKPDQQHLLRKAYAAFYWSINFGSFFALLAIPYIREHYGYGWAFGVPGIAMAVATFVFWRGTKYYTHVPPTKETKNAGFFQVFGTALGNQTGGRNIALLNALTSMVLPMLAIIGLAIVGFSHIFFGRYLAAVTPALRVLNWISLGSIGLWYALAVALTLVRRSQLPDSFWQKARGKFNDHEISAARSVSPILFVFALVPIFWALFDQTSSTWVLQGRHMMKAIFGPWPLPFGPLTIGSFTVIPSAIGPFTIGEEQMQSANALLVMILIPIMTLGVYPLLGRLATPLRRMSVGMFVAAASYVVVALLQKRIDAGAQMSLLWQIVPYAVLTTAEVLVSTTGLEFAFREAAPEMKSMITGVWQLTVTMGNLMVVGITKAFPGSEGQGGAVSASRFMTYAGLTAIVAVLFSIISAFYTYRDKRAAEGQ